MTSLSATILAHSPDMETHIERVRHCADRVTGSCADIIKKPSRFSVLICDDEYSQSLNHTYRGQEKPTNILSFEDGSDEDGEIYLGDLVVSLQTMEKEYQEMGISFEDHWCHILIHGVLHLLGHDHIEDEEAEIMENLEILWLAKIGIKNPYEDDETVRV